LPLINAFERIFDNTKLLQKYFVLSANQYLSKIHKDLQWLDHEMLNFFEEFQQEV
jgi:hypothetical protein